MCVFTKSPKIIFREVSLALVTVFFIAAIHTVMDPITEPPHRDAVGLVSAPELILFALSHTIHLCEHRHQLGVNGWEQQQLSYTARREQPLMETAPEWPCLECDLEKTNFFTPKLWTPPLHRVQKHKIMGLRMQENPHLPFQLFLHLKKITKKNHTRKRPKPPEMSQVPHQSCQHSPAPRCISRTPKCSLHLHTRTHLKSRLEMLVTNTYFSIKKKAIH